MALQMFASQPLLPPLTSEELAAMNMLARDRFSVQMALSLHGFSVTDDATAAAADLLEHHGIIECIIRDTIPGFEDEDIGYTNWYRMTEAGIARAKVVQ